MSDSYFQKRCKTFRCPNLHHNRNGYCDECNAKRSADYRYRKTMTTGTPLDTGGASIKGKQRGAGYDHAWYKFAREFLLRHPVCAICGKPAQVCDHKEIPADVMLDMWGRFSTDESDYQPLCFSCNRRKADSDRRKREEYFSMKKDLHDRFSQEKDDMPFYYDGLEEDKKKDGEEEDKYAGYYL